MSLVREHRKTYTSTKSNQIVQICSSPPGPDRRLLAGPLQPGGTSPSRQRFPPTRSSFCLRRLCSSSDGELAETHFSELYSSISPFRSYSAWYLLQRLLSIPLDHETEVFGLSAFAIWHDCNRRLLIYRVEYTFIYRWARCKLASNYTDPLLTVLAMNGAEEGFKVIRFGSHVTALPTCSLK